MWNTLHDSCSMTEDHGWVDLVQRDQRHPECNTTTRPWSTMPGGARSAVVKPCPLWCGIFQGHVELGRSFLFNVGRKTDIARPRSRLWCQNQTSTGGTASSTRTRTCGRHQLWPKPSLAIVFYHLWPNHHWPNQEQIFVFEVVSGAGSGARIVRPLRWGPQVGPEGWGPNFFLFPPQLSFFFPSLLVEFWWCF